MSFSLEYAVLKDRNDEAVPRCEHNEDIEDLEVDIENVPRYEEDAENDMEVLPVNENQLEDEVAERNSTGDSQTVECSIDLPLDACEIDECKNVENSCTLSDVQKVTFNDKLSNENASLSQKPDVVSSHVFVEQVDLSTASYAFRTSSEVIDTDTSYRDVQKQESSIQHKLKLDFEISDKNTFSKSSILVKTSSHEDTDRGRVCKGNGNGLNRDSGTCLPTASAGAASEKVVTVHDDEVREVCFITDNSNQDKRLETEGKSVNVPCLDQLCENESGIVNLHMDLSSSNIPNLEILLQDMTESSNKLTLDSEENNDNTTVADILKEIRSELIDKEDTDDFGLTLLFEDSKQKHGIIRAKSKATKKRKRQLQSLQKKSASQDNRKRKFVQTFQELRSSQVVLDEQDIDSSMTCPVCLEMYHLPRTCNPCGHMFCDPCLRRLTGQGSEGIPCPLCRTVISSCDLNKDFDEYLLQSHPCIYAARASLECNSKFRYYQLPYTTPVPLGKRLMRQLIASRNSQSHSSWMSHDWFKFLLGCTAGMCLSLLIMLFNRVKSVRDARDVNIVFLSILIGASLTFLIFKFIKI